MSRKVVVVGGDAGGASAAARIRRLDEFADITIFERGPHVSFSNCCLPYFLDRTIEDAETLVLMNPEKFKTVYNINVAVNCEVVDILRDSKQVEVRRADGSRFFESYDSLVLSPGGRPIRPRSIKGIDKEHVFTVRNVEDICKLDSYCTEHNVKHVAVVGGGFIGCEIAESFKKSDREVTLVEKSDHLLPSLDCDMAQHIHRHVMLRGVSLVLNDALESITDDRVLLSSGREVIADAVVLSLGVVPETALAMKAGLETGETGAIKVDQNYRTSDPDIYAVGDAIEVFNAITRRYQRLPLAFPAQMEARRAANAICGLPVRNRGVIGSSVVRVFDLFAASCGLNEQSAKAHGIPYDFVYLLGKDRVKIMPSARPLFFKLLFEVPTGRVLGAQAVGEQGVDKRINAVAAVIRMGGTLEDIAELELCYAPVVSSAKDFVNLAGLVGLNLLHGRFRQVHLNQVRELVENNAYIVDVREPGEYERGHILNAHNIPLSELRKRYREIPDDRPVYLHCLSSFRSYHAICILQQLGFDNLYNIDGSFMGVVLEQWAMDQITQRKPIVTSYEFG